MTIHSMTAFARETSPAPAAVVVELRSVNHRYLDCHFKLPDALRSIEPRLREALTKGLARGKVDCLLRVEANAVTGDLQLDNERLAQVADAVGTLREHFETCAAPDPLAVLQFPGVLRESGTDESELAALAVGTFERALDTLRGTREREGRQLAEFLRLRLEGLAREVRSLRDELPELRRRQDERLRARLAELDEAVDEGRLEQELVLLLHKGDIDEELDRLDAHRSEVERVLEKGGPCGRRLDFLMQELNREANTIASKASASRTSQSAVELKVLIEQMREQVQNIE
jgi:uncharacterized protein (TIGR00255 family)